jgi:hypothetical protein
MTAEQYEEAVNVLAGLIVSWTRSRAFPETGSEATADQGAAISVP